MLNKLHFILAVILSVTQSVWDSANILESMLSLAGILARFVRDFENIVSVNCLMLNGGMCLFRVKYLVTHSFISVYTLQLSSKNFINASTMDH